MQQDGGTRRGGRRVGRRWFHSFDLYTGILSWVENREVVMHLSFAGSDDAKIVRSRYAQCNTEESP